MKYQLNRGVVYSGFAGRAYVDWTSTQTAIKRMIVKNLERESTAAQAPKRMIRSVARRCILAVGLAVALAVGWSFASSHRELEAEAAALLFKPLVIEVTGSKKTWSVTYPTSPAITHGADSIPADREIRLPVGTEVTLVFKSTDYVYTFAIPQRRLKQLAVPSLQFEMNLSSAQPCCLQFVGEGLCGDPHTQVPGRLVFVPQKQFLQWLRMQR
jgi:heme/copper-type cytochrome/quinol oxidase subunit 2